MNERPVLLDFHENLQKILGEVIHQENLTPEEARELCALALVLSVDMERFPEQSKVFLRTHAGNQRCEEALSRFCLRMREMLSRKSASGQ